MKKKRFAFVIAIALAFVLLIMPIASRADFGGYSGSSDYGSSDSGSSDSSSSWDSGSSSSSWGSNNDSYSSGSTYYAGDDDNSSGGGFGGIIALIVIAVIVYYVIKPFLKKNKTADVPEGAQRTPDSMLKPITDYGALDANFNASALSEKLSNLYVQMQNGWQARDIESLRPYFTDAMYEQFDRQLTGMKKSGRTNYIERIAVLGVTLRGFYQQDASDHVVAELRTRIVDYTLDDKTGSVVSGDRDKEKFMTYEWDLVRPTGTLTQPEGTMSKVNCPNCGAPLSINATAKCPYCGTVVTLKQHDWAIFAIKGIAQRTAN